jgi:hypothetical protein
MAHYGRDGKWAGGRGGRPTLKLTPAQALRLRLAARVAVVVVVVVVVAASAAGKARVRAVDGATERVWACTIDARQHT